jgi:Mg-chelatase subunit ChlD
MTILPLALIVLAAGAEAQAPSSSLRVVMLADTSGSMTNDVPFRRGDRTFLTDATAGLDAALRPDESRSIETFGNGGASPLWDSLDGVVRSLNGASGRVAILVITDGRTTGNTLSFAEILQRLGQAHVPVFFICAERPKDLEVADPSVRLRQLAAASGGQYTGIKNNLGIRPPKPDEIRRAIADAIRAMRNGAI